MIQKRLYESDINKLVKDVLFITLVAALFLILVSKFGGYVSDKMTKASCNAINEVYVKGAKPGDGLCVRSTDTVDYKK